MPVGSSSITNELPPSGTHNSPERGWNNIGREFLHRQNKQRGGGIVVVVVLFVIIIIVLVVGGGGSGDGGGGGGEKSLQQQGHLALLPFVHFYHWHFNPSCAATPTTATNLTCTSRLCCIREQSPSASNSQEQARCILCGRISWPIYLFIVKPNYYVLD